LRSANPEIPGLAFGSGIDIPSTEQSGFRKKHSTATALADVTDFILVNMNNRNFIGSVFIDLKKAFDTVDCFILARKLEKYGVKDTELQWFKNYLTNRSQRVQYKQCLSDPLPVSTGVPQGSVLGPLLFNIYINDLPRVVQHCKISLYADDTALFVAGKDAIGIQSILNSELEAISKWLYANKLTLNVQKTKAILFGTPQLFNCRKPPQLCVVINNKIIENVECFKYLGLHLDSHMTYSVHIEKTCKKLKMRLGVTKMLRKVVDLKTCTTLFNALALPVFDYCNFIYMNASACHTSRLQVLQNRFARCIMFAHCRSHSIELLRAMNWLSVYERSQLSRLVLVLQSQRGNVPIYLQNIFTTNENLTGRNKLIIHRMQNEAGKRSFLYSGAVGWNNLPQNIREVGSTLTFKSLVREHLVHQRDERDRNIYIFT